MVEIDSGIITPIIMKPTKDLLIAECPVVDSSCNKSIRHASSLMQMMSLLEKMKL